MSDVESRPAGIPESLTRLRLRLTAWYVGTLLVILLLIGIGLFATVTRRFDSELDLSLRDATVAVENAARAHGIEASSSYALVGDRRLIVFDSAGRAVGEPVVDSWIRRFAADAASRGEASISHRAGEERILRAFARPFSAADGHRYVAVAVADEVEIEDKYATLIGVAGSAALIALVLVGVGGWIVARQSTEPVERTVAHMRRFMADAAHELRTPIAVVRGRAEVALQRSRHQDDYRDALRGIEQESIRLGRIVDDLLILARADAGERPIQRSRVFLDDVTLDAAEAARTLAERHHVRVDVVEFEESPVDGDPVLLRQLVLILLDNAIKFSRESGAVQVYVRARDGCATLDVVDEGIGIPAEHLPHVFERFYRGDLARARDGTGVSEGAGLGLAIAQWIAGVHGASIRLDSESGHGARAVVQFPRPSLT